jgi:hypothetical protein
MSRLVQAWHRTLWCGVSAPMLLLLAGDLVRTSSWKMLMPANVDRAPVEESERGEEEVVASTPRQRTRCRPAAAAPSVPQPPLQARLTPHSHTAAVGAAFYLSLSANGFPLRC